MFSVAKKEDRWITWVIIGLVVMAVVMVAILLREVKNVEKYSSLNVEAVAPGETLVHLGETDAPNEIIYIFDYLCPWCTVWIDEILPELEDLIDSGELKFRTQAMSLLDTASLELAEVDENLKVHYPESYFDVFTELIQDSTEMSISEDYLKALATTHDLDYDKLTQETDFDMESLTEAYQEAYDIEYVPTIIVNGERVEDSFEVEDIKALLTK